MIVFFYMIIVYIFIFGNKVLLLLFGISLFVMVCVGLINFVLFFVMGVLLDWIG